MQLSEYISTIANNGERVFPHILKYVSNENKDIIYNYVPKKHKISVDKKYINRVKKGFEEVLKSGLGINYMGNVENPAGKTGTSESFYDTSGDGIIDTSTVSNAFVGYYPSSNPKMSIAITFPNIMTINGNNDYRSYANKRITKRIVELFNKMY
jgi:cell division protein FtsI/penicillin-binding protein 2